MKLICSIALALGILIQPTSAREEWDGHLARLDTAKTACAQMIYSDACEPYLAEAVGIVDYIAWEHPDRQCEKLNGEDVTRPALIMDE